jgi:hypothetical protein
LDLLDGIAMLDHAELLEHRVREHLGQRLQ